ncbi:MAG: hypothetical protein HQK60_09840 [Deltaproteobacteria bacterium]|nr:hypothetical protein [Deltaproteobacteria bacterium]
MSIIISAPGLPDKRRDILSATGPNSTCVEIQGVMIVGGVLAWYGVLLLFIELTEGWA